MLTDVVGPLHCQHLKKNIVNPCTQGPTEEKMMLRISMQVGPEAAGTVAAAARVNVRDRSIGVTKLQDSFNVA